MDAGNHHPLLDVKNMKMHFPITSPGLLRRVSGYIKAVDDVTLDIRQGEILGLVGESGCGKTTLGRCIVRAYQPTAGKLLYHEAFEFTEDIHKLRVHMRHRGSNNSEYGGHVVDLAKFQERDLAVYRREIRMIFQDPYSSLNPRLSVRDNVAEPLKNHNIARGSELDERVADLLRQVGLPPETMRRYPHAFSGGQRQRIGIARALALNPRLIIADEAVSALDVSVRAQILNLLLELQRKFDLTYLFISHDLSVVKYISDRVAVMYVGKLVEMAATEELYHNPQHPYTEALMSAIPKPDPRMRSQRIVLEGDVPDPSNPPGGCYFHPRCQYAKDRCALETPELREVRQDHFVACHFAEELQLRGLSKTGD